MALHWDGTPYPDVPELITATWRFDMAVWESVNKVCIIFNNVSHCVYWWLKS